jgi:hypothetical protein
MDGRDSLPDAPQRFAALRSCETIAGRRLNRLRHQKKSCVCMVGQAVPPANPDHGRFFHGF